MQIAGVGCEKAITSGGGRGGGHGGDARCDGRADLDRERRRLLAGALTCMSSLHKVGGLRPLAGLKRP